MPVAVYLLALAVFAQGTSEFMLSGLLPAIAADLHVSLSQAGLLTSAFAAGMIVGAPLLGVLSLRWPPRTALLAFLSVFIAAHIVAALGDDYPLLLACRVAGALANAGFLAVALVSATTMAAPGATARTTSVLLGGVTVACVAGVPAGALLGQLWGWRAAFWAVVLVSLPALAAIVAKVPGGGGRPAARALGEFRALGERTLLATLVTGALVNAATFATFTYLASMITGVSGLPGGWIPAVLALFGAGSFAGVTMAGRWADRRPVLLTAGGERCC